MPIENGADLLLRLHALNLIEPERYPHWWRHYGSWWIIPEAILTQQTRFEKVEASVANLIHLGYDTPEKLAAAEQWRVAQAIVPAGFYNQKAVRILSLINGLIETYGDFEHFVAEVSREWLLAHKGVGFESADAILCYGCQRPVMVVDRYTQRLLAALGFEMEEYHDIQAWLTGGIEGEFDRIEAALGLTPELTYAYFHGLIVEYCKDHARRSGMDIAKLSA